MGYAARGPTYFAFLQIISRHNSYSVLFLSLKVQTESLISTWSSSVLHNDASCSRVDFETEGMKWKNIYFLIF